MRDRTNTNSAAVAVVVLILGVLSWWWQGWPGAVVYVLGFLAGGIGTAVNAARSGRVP